MVSFGTPEYKRITLSLALGSFLVFSNLYLFTTYAADLRNAVFHFRNAG